MYFAYPAYLYFVRSQAAQEKATGNIDRVSLVFLSYNGKPYIGEKINFLLRELASFPEYELIIIDDFSEDATHSILETFRNTKQVKIIQKTFHQGIAHSMNLAVSLARFDYIIFCDQRQKLSPNIVRNILEPLKSGSVGAVSGCLSCIDKDQKNSILRKHENFIKSQESKSGCLIGVYGPFYAIKKQHYTPVPENVILDDLYLSLKILQKSQIKLETNCTITDEDFSALYTFQRARRYLSGFLQLLKDKEVITGLSAKQKIMLFWHKYLRLSIPVLLFASYISLGLMIADGLIFFIFFVIITVLMVISVSSRLINHKFRFINLIRMNIYYFMAIIDIILLTPIKNLR